MRTEREDDNEEPLRTFKEPYKEPTHDQARVGRDNALQGGGEAPKGGHRGEEAVWADALRSE